MGRTKAYKDIIIEESLHMGTVEPVYELEDGKETKCFSFLNGAIKKYGCRKEIYLHELFEYLQNTSLSYLQEYYQYSRICEVPLPEQKGKATKEIFAPIYFVDNNERLRGVELAFIYSAIQCEANDFYDKVELLNYIVKVCQIYLEMYAKKVAQQKKKEERL